MTTVSGEPVEVLGPKPEGWTGLGQTYVDAVLVRYPDGEIGAVPRGMLKDAPKEDTDG